VQNGGRGHIFVKLVVGSHPFLRREGSDIHYDASISMAQAALGTSIPVPTLTGEVTLKVPPGTQPNEQRLMRGRGVRVLNRGPNVHGDQYIHFKVQVPGPNKMSRKARELLEQFAREQGEQVNWTTPNPDFNKPSPPSSSSSSAAPASSSEGVSAASSGSSSATSASAESKPTDSSTNTTAAEGATSDSAASGKKEEADAADSNANGSGGGKKKKKGGVFGSLFK
jgi:molecular chaperone DnaJ